MVPVVVGLTVMEPLAVGFSVSSSAVDGYHDFWRVAACYYASICGAVGSGAFLVVVQSVIVASRFGAVGMVLSVVVLPASCYMYK